MKPLAPWQLRAWCWLWASLLVLSWALMLVGSVVEPRPEVRVVAWVPSPDPRTGAWQVVWQYGEAMHLALTDTRAEAMALYAVLAGNR